jgi:hypothetical protein
LGSIPLFTFVLAAVSLASMLVLLWAVQWNLSVGQTASDTGGSGVNDAAWYWFFGSAAATATSVTALAVNASDLRRANRRKSTEVPVLAAPYGWYADPFLESRMRYWDGMTWTALTA